jgi:hypothetical protein
MILDIKTSITFFGIFIVMAGCSNVFLKVGYAEPEQVKNPNLMREIHVEYCDYQYRRENYSKVRFDKLKNKIKEKYPEQKGWKNAVIYIHKRGSYFSKIPNVCYVFEANFP